jgi:hypothetical protein
MAEIIEELIMLAGFTPDAAIDFADRYPNNARHFVMRVKQEIEKDEKLHSF